MTIGMIYVCGTCDVQDEREKVLVTAAIDSTAFFHYLAYGANDAVASIAVMMATAEAIGRSGVADALEKQPLFFLANAEEFGYAGSRRFARDLTTGISCSSSVSAVNSSSGLPLCTDPIYPSTLFQRIDSSSITDAIAIDQLGRLNNGQLYLHSVSSEPSNLDVFEQVAKSLDGVSVSASAATSAVPPSPLNSFMAALPSLQNTGVVLSGYDAAFNDPTFHSRFDREVSLQDIIR
jgi:hypothetical protein